MCFSVKAEDDIKIEFKNSADKSLYDFYDMYDDYSATDHDEDRGKHRSNGRSNVMITSKGSYQKSAPYVLQKLLFVPQKHYNYRKIGIASYYGGTDTFHGKKTAIGTIFSKDYYTAAHRTLPLPCVVKVTNLNTGKEIYLIVEDRGPYIKGRLIDVSKRAAKNLGFERQGTAYVKIECVPKLSRIISRIFSAAQKGSTSAKALYEKMRKHGITVKS